MRIASDTRDMDTNQYLIVRLDQASRAGAVGAQTDARVHELLNQNRAQLGVEGYQFLSDRRYETRPLRKLYVGGNEATLWLFFAASLCVLFIAAINLTNLVVLRSITRSHDSAVRLSLGATPLRLALPALSEALLIGMLGGALGLVLAWLGLKVFRSVAPPEWLLGAAPELGAAGWIFALAGGVLVALVAAVIGVWRGYGDHLSQELIGGGRSGMSMGSGRLGRILVVAQVSIAALLLVGSGLFMRSLYELSSIPMGFQESSVVTFSLSPVKSLYPDAAAVSRQATDIIDQLQQLPGAEAAGAASNLPVGSQLNLPVSLPDGSAVQPQFRVVTPRFFSVFGIKLIAGRALGDTDDSRGEQVCVVSRVFAQQHFGGDALGKPLRMGRGSASGGGMRIVGIVDDVRSAGAAQDSPPTIYVPLAQMSNNIWGVLSEFGPLHYAVHMRSGTGQQEAALRAAVQAAAPSQPIADVLPMSVISAQMTSVNRLHLALVGIFAVLALALASVGLYAVLSVNVASRKHEYGVRAALGASPRDLVLLAMRGAGAQVAIGLVIGVACALVAGKSVKQFLFKVDVWDPVSLTCVVLALALAALMASLGPSLRASRADPIQSLRNE